MRYSRWISYSTIRCRLCRWFSRKIGLRRIATIRRRIGIMRRIGSWRIGGQRLGRIRRWRLSCISWRRLSWVGSRLLCRVRCSGLCWCDNSYRWRRSRGSDKSSTWTTIPIGGTDSDTKTATDARANQDKNYNTNNYPCD